MSDILFVKTSSLGDVIHHLPALTEARRRRPDARFFWVVEEAFAPLVRLHPAVAGVILWSRRDAGRLLRLKERSYAPCQVPAQALINVSPSTPRQSMDSCCIALHPSDRRC
jgi:ADP-heptose:LPS heptosyltransferase